MNNRNLRALFLQPVRLVILQKNEKFRTGLVFMFLITSIFSLILTVYAAGKFEFYYFNPDSVQSNFSLLTKGFGDFLKKAELKVSFQAFTQKVDFDRRIKDQKPALVLVPFWYYEKYGETLGLTPLLTSLESGKPNYTKILLVRKTEPFTVEELKGRTVAMTTMGPDTEELLAKNFFGVQGLDFSTMNIIITPKDADALYSLALGQVDAALVGQATLSIVGSANRRVLEGIQEVMVSSPVPMPMLCVMPGTMDESEITRLKQVFMEGGRQAIMPNYMKMLNINGWQNAL